MNLDYDLNEIMTELKNYYENIIEIELETKENNKVIKIMNDNNIFKDDNTILLINRNKKKFDNNIKFNKSGNYKLLILNNNKIEKLKELFKDCKEIKKIKFYKINTQNVTDINLMFEKIYEDNKINKEIKIEQLTNVKTFKSHSEYISNLIILSDERIASCSLDSYIKIYNNITFEEEISIKENSYVDWIEQIKNGMLISCPRDNTIRIYEINGKNYKNIKIINEKSSAWKMKELENGNLISAMSDGNIKVWKFVNNEIKCEFSLNNEIISNDILEIQKNIVVVHGFTQIYFFDLNKRERIKSISGFEFNSYNVGKKFCKVNDELLLIYGKKNLYIVDILSY